MYLKNSIFHFYGIKRHKRPPLHYWEIPVMQEWAILSTN